MPGGYFVHNGQLFREGKAVISPDNRSFRYGDGLFETMRIVKGDIKLKQFHFERLLNGMKLLQFDIPEFFTPANLESDILALCEKNRIETGAIIRMVIFRSDGGLYDLDDMRPNYIIQSMAFHQLPPVKDDGKGIVIDVYPDTSKACNVFSSLKSNNFLPYIMGVIFAKQKKLDDCIILNQYGRIADATAANVFCIKEKIIYTPPLSEGGVSGVTRRFLLNELPIVGLKVEESPLSVENLEAADEIFLTNAIRGVRLVEQFKNKKYTPQISKVVQRLWKEKLA
ncbi:MAG: aminotransferase class IV [Bacteroidetes bacterium]|nr:aminotransferase class IV [Bacteroidota bacterium]